MADGWKVLVHGGTVLPVDPGPASTFLRSSAPGVYTTTRTVGGASSVLLWERHMARLSESLQLLMAASPQLYPFLRQDVDVKRLVQPSVRVGLAEALQRRRAEEEIALSVLLCGRKLAKADPTAADCEVYVHASKYNALGGGKMPLATSVAVMGPGRSLARVKSSLWASTRQGLEKARPAGTSEIILSTDGDALLEGTLTNFFVVAKTKETMLNDSDVSTSSVVGKDSHWRAPNDVEVQTAPLEDGVLPGVIRSLVIEVCRTSGIPFREVAPSWDMRRTWREAFVTSSIRILQPVVKIQMPTIRNFELSPWSQEGSTWEHFKLEECGAMTREIHELVVERAKEENISVVSITGGILGGAGFWFGELAGGKLNDYPYGSKSHFLSCDLNSLVSSGNPVVIDR